MLVQVNAFLTSIEFLLRQRFSGLSQLVAKESG